MKRLLVLILLFVLSWNVKSQNYDADAKGHFFSMSPQYILINGFRVDFEKRFKESAHALAVSPTLFTGNIGSSTLLYSDYYNYELNGLGAEIAHKIYTQKSWDRNVNWYQGYSLTYNYFDLAYEGFTWMPIDPNGNVLALREGDQKLTINQIALATFVGALVELDERLFFDVYLGIGAKRSFASDSSSDKLAEEDLQDGFINYNFSGGLLKGGFKVGVAF